MHQSQTIQALSKALVAAQSELSNVGYDKANPHFKSQYTSLAAICNEVRPVMNRHGLAVLQLPGYTVIGDATIKTLTTRLLHQSGEWLEETMILNPVKDDPQGVGSAITYCRRYSLPGVGLIASSDGTDDDGDEASATKASLTPAMMTGIRAYIPTIPSVKEIGAYWRELLDTYAIGEGSAIHSEIYGMCQARRNALKAEAESKEKIAA